MCPKTAENVRQMCTGEFRCGLCSMQTCFPQEDTELQPQSRRGQVATGYKQCSLHRIIKAFMVL